MFCGSERTRTYELVRGRIYSPLQLPLCDTPDNHKSIFLIYHSDPYVLLATAAFVAEKAAIVYALYLEQFLSAVGTYCQLVADAGIALLCVHLCNYGHIGILSLAKLSLFSNKTKCLDNKSMLYSLK